MSGFPVVPLSAAGTRALGRGLLAASLVVALLVGARGMSEEAAVSVQGDMPRYLVDGVFLYDFLGSGAGWTAGGPITYAQHYFAQYPALSIGHHPPLLPMSLVPFYALFGISVLAARLAILTFFALAVLFLYTLVSRIYDEEAAGWACLLFASNPMLSWYAQRVMSEMPTVALVLATLNALLWFCDLGRLRDYILFIVLSVVSLTARQLAIFMWPAYVAVLATRGGWARIVRRDVIGVTLAGAVFIVPVAIATVLLSPFNVAVVRDVFAAGPALLSRVALIDPIARGQLLPSLGVVAVAGFAAAFVRRDSRILIGVYWVVSVIAGVMFITGPFEPVRYSFLALPAFCMAAGSLLHAAPSPSWRRNATIALTVAVVFQLWWLRDARPARFTGYEDAARFVIAETASGAPAPTVLYSASLDTGIFVFFIRKYDPARQLVVLRADKLLTTSLMGQVSVEDRIGSPQEIYGALDRFGTRFIVIEDSPSGSQVLEWLRAELKGDRFVARRRLAVDPTGIYSDRSLVVYEYKGARPADPNAQIDLKVPLIGREVHVPLAALGKAP